MRAATAPSVGFSAGLAYVPDQMIAADLSKKKLERVLENFLTEGPGLYLYFPARTQSQPKLRALIDMIRRVEGRTTD